MLRKMKSCASIRFRLPLSQGKLRIRRQPVLDIEPNGGAEGARTPDLLNAIEALSQLSYSPTKFKYSRGSLLAQGTRGPLELNGAI